MYLSFFLISILRFAEPSGLSAYRFRGIFCFFNERFYRCFCPFLQLFNGFGEFLKTLISAICDLEPNLLYIGTPLGFSLLATFFVDAD